MFYERILLRPSLGKENEVRALMEETTKSNQPRLRTVLTESVLGEGQTFVSGTFHENLKAYETERESRRANPGFGSFVAKISGMVSRPREAQLYEVISPTSGVGDAHFTRVTEVTVAHDKEAEAREALENFARAIQAESGRAPGIHRRLFPTEGPTFLIIGTYKDLGEYESLHSERPESVRNMRAKIDPFITARREDLFQVIVPFPS